MAKDIFISSVNSRKRVALTDGGKLIELHVERDQSKKVVGNIYRGRVVNVLEGMQAAFINIGLERNAYLFVGDLAETEEIRQKGLGEKELSISVGDDVMVQVVKDQIGTKGARVTTRPTLSGRLLVMMPCVNYVGLSRKITHEPTRKRLYQWVTEDKPQSGGFVIRTAATTATREEIREEIRYLTATYESILARYENASVTEAVFEEGDLIYRSLRDLITPDVQHIYVNDRRTFYDVTSVISTTFPHLKEKVLWYDGADELFEHFRLTEQIDALLERKVPLENGAYLVIDRTEALTIIDVNTGKYVGASNLEETVFQTNLLAAAEIARQLRLRNIGGIIICDFIDMVTDEHKKEVLSVLSKELAKDRIRSTLLGMTDLCLVEITRKKTHNEISTTMLQPCPYCGGDGEIHSNDYVCFRLRGKLFSALATEGATGALVKINPAVMEYVLRFSYFTEDIEEYWENKRIYLLAEEGRHPEAFEVTPLYGKVLDLPQGAKMLY